MLTLKDIPIKTKGFVIREIGDELIIISENGSEMHTIDEIGSFIWNNINGKNSIQSIVDRICNEYEVKKQIAQKDLMNFIKSLINKKLILLKRKLKQ